MSNTLRDNVRIFHTNIRSLRYKFDNLLDLLDGFDCVFDMIIITECWLKEDEIQFYSLPNYNCSHALRESDKAGGVMIYTRNNLNAQETVGSIGDSEMVEISLIDYKITICAIYRRHNGDIGNFLTNLENYFENSKNNDYHILLGDINIDLKKKNLIVSEYNYIIESADFKHVISDGTRKNAGNNSESCLDHIVVRENNSRCSIELEFCDYHKLSDHKAQIIRVDFKNMNLSHMRMIDDINRKIHSSQLDIINNNINVSMVDNSSLPVINCGLNNNEDVDCCLSYLMKNIESNTNNNYDLHNNKTNQAKSKKDKPWINPSILQKIKKRNSLYKKLKKQPFNNNLKKDYTKIRDKIHTLIKKEKFNYYNYLIRDNTDKRNLWSTLDNIIHRKNKQANRIPILKILYNNQLITDANLIAKSFEEYYSLNNFPDSGFFRDENEFRISNDQNDFDPIKIRYYFNQNYLKIKNDNRIDNTNICPILIKNNAFIRENLYRIIFFSLKNGHYPMIIANAITIPIYKKGHKNLIENYRPITISNTISRLFEGIVFDLCNLYSSLNNVFHDSQYGFRKNMGTADALIDLNAFINYERYNGKIICALFIDFTKAFDLIHHRILIQNLINLNFPMNIVKWIQDFLLKRTSSIKINNYIGGSLKCNRGVPQGSALAPLLFNIYIRSLLEVIPDNVHKILYADDLVLIFSEEDKNNLQSIIDLTTDLLFDWSNDNYMIINTQKTKHMIFSNKKFDEMREINVTINGRVIDRVPDITYLGYVVDEQLNNKNHIDCIIKRIAPPTGALYRAKNKLDIKNKVKIFHALINSVVIYGITIWCHSNNKEKDIVERILKKSYRSIFGNNYNNAVLANHGILNLENTIIYYDCIMAFRNIHNIVITSLNYKIKLILNTNLRSNNEINIDKPYYKSSKLHKSILIRPIDHFNRLPSVIKNIRDLRIFKVNLKMHLLKNQS